MKIQAPEIVPKGLPNSLRTPLDDLAAQIAAGTLHVQVGKVFRLDEIAEAHRCMGENKGSWEVRDADMKSDRKEFADGRNQ